MSVVLEQRSTAMMTSHFPVNGVKGVNQYMFCKQSIRTDEGSNVREASLVILLRWKYDPNQLVTDSIVCVNSAMI